jgi:hypothetical protein
MRLSEAMMLGDSLRTRNWSLFLSVNKPYCGCALGGAQLAVGDESRGAFRTHWPWITTIVDRKRGHTYEDIIGCLCKGFEHLPHFSGVMRGIFTFEQLVDHVRSIEPECGECNRFECSCVKPAGVHEVESLVSEAS